MLPSGITTLLCPALGCHTALAFICVHILPLSIDLHTSSLKPNDIPSSPPIRTILPSGITTLLCPSLVVQQLLAFTCVQGALKSSSPKYHAQPLGVPEERSVNEMVSGAVPEVTLEVKLATGTVSMAPALPKSNESISKIRKYRAILIVYLPESDFYRGASKRWDILFWIDLLEPKCQRAPLSSSFSLSDFSTTRIHYPLVGTYPFFRPDFCTDFFLDVLLQNG
jgi:hypothetical protein